MFYGVMFRLLFRLFHLFRLFRHVLGRPHYKRVRGDMIETYKILSGKYDINVVPNLKTTGIQAIRGNDLRIFNTRFKYDLRKFYFTNRVVDAWNSLPNLIFMANSILTLLNTG